MIKFLIERTGIGKYGLATNILFIVIYLSSIRIIFAHERILYRKRPLILPGNDFSNLCYQDYKPLYKKFNEISIADTATVGGKKDELQIFQDNGVLNWL